MEKRKLLLADGTEEFRLALSEALADAYELKICTQGREALEVARSFQPDLLVLDLALPELDGLSLLQQLRESGLRPVVLASSRFQSDYLQDALRRLEVGYLMSRPCDVRAMVAIIADMAQWMDHPVYSHADPKAAVSDLLLSLGISAKVRGYDFLREAILMTMRERSLQITKVVYPAIAAGHRETNARQVERTMRNAIETAFARRDDRRWRQYFQCGADGELKRPSNAEFVRRLADVLLLQGEEDRRRKSGGLWG